MNKVYILVHIAKKVFLCTTKREHIKPSRHMSV